MFVFVFVFINFLIAFFSDLFLNFLSRKNTTKTINALRSYFTHYNNSFLTAIYAGLTVVVVLIINILLVKLLFGFSVPQNIQQLIRFLSLAVPLGYIADVFIYKYKVFGKTLDAYYKVGGAGLWGAAAYVFSIVISYILLLLPNHYLL
jgi:hypothetical protein